MATQPAPGIAQVEMILTDDAQRVQNTYHVDKGGGAAWTLPELETLLDCFYDTLWADIKPLVGSAMTLISLVATDLTSLTGYKIARAIDPPEAGTNASPILPNSVTKAIRLDTGSRGKGENGRVFVPSLSEADVTNNTVGGVALAAWVAALEALRLAIPGAVPGAFLCVLSRYLDKVKRPVAIGRPVVHINTANANIDVQKDRLPGHKKHKKRIIPV